MKLTKNQIKLLRFYAKYQNRSVTLLDIASNFWLAWLLLLLAPALGCWCILNGLAAPGWLMIGMGFGAFLRDWNRILSLARTWAVICEIINWERLKELIEGYEKDAA